MVELNARVEGGGVLVAGDTIHCTLLFTNTDDRPQTIGWTGVQLHCQCLTRPDVVKLRGRESVSSPISDTAFIPTRGEKGVSVLSTQSTVLLCNVTLKPKETRTVTYSEQVPTGGPPSFSGRMVRYIYKLTIGAQKPNCQTQIARIPIKVIIIPARLQQPRLTSPQSTNPFLVSEEQQTLTEIGLEAIVSEAARRNTGSYTLTAAGQSLGRVIVPRTSYKLGDEVTSIFDCSNCVRPVLQATVSLTYSETVHEACVVPPAGIKPVVTTVAQQTECCNNSLVTHFALPLPPHLTQSFSNDTVAVEWNLQFQLIVSKDTWSDCHVTRQSIGPGGGVAEQWVGPLPQNVESVSWSLPLTILPSLYSDSIAQLVLTL